MADHIIMLKHGKIIERGTYEELMSQGKSFSKLIAEFGKQTKKKKKNKINMN